MTVYAIRGAITVDCDDAAEIADKSVKLAREIAQKNAYNSIVSIIVSMTDDITAYYPAKAIRESGVLDAPIFSCIEPRIKGGLPMCIRLLVTVCSENETEAHHVYMDGARVLRKDIAE